jgi:osomolarity two-component system phosphorelay intermediate protein YPD1
VNGDGGIMSIPGAEDTIDPSTFEQILEMDEDEAEREFSQSIVYDFFTQAEGTFVKMDTNLCVWPLRQPPSSVHYWPSPSEKKDLKTLSELGHFLKGSSATLGLTKVKDSCEKIQHYGQLKDETGAKDIKEDEALKSLDKIIKQAKDEFHEVEKVLKKFYNDDEWAPPPALDVPSSITMEARQAHGGTCTARQHGIHRQPLLPHPPWHAAPASRPLGLRSFVAASSSGPLVSIASLWTLLYDSVLWIP